MSFDAPAAIRLRRWLGVGHSFDPDGRAAGPGGGPPGGDRRRSRPAGGSAGTGTGSTISWPEAETTAETLRALNSWGPPVGGRLRHRLLLAQLLEAVPRRRPQDRPLRRGRPAQDPDDEAIVTAVISLAEALKLEVVAEGVEHPDQVRKLHRLGCTAVQGHLFGPPGEPDALIQAASPLVTALAVPG